MPRFAGKVAVVTGAAGGIGQAIAARFGQEGAKVVAVDLGGGALDDAVAKLRQQGVEAIGVAADVRRASQVEACIVAARSQFGAVDILCNNAGIEGWVGPSVDYPEEVFDQVLAVNVKGVWLGMKYAVPAMRERGGGVIINTSSVAGLEGYAGIIAYVASKHAVIGLTKSAAIEFAPDRIRVNAVCPAPIETRMMRALERGYAPDDPEAVHQSLAKNIPMARYGEPAEVAAVVVFLASDDASYITGGTYTVDGGTLAG
jgi:NAD(P)-dependent dehydrogenase (short-subunit alcohol dehydrogenase family)